MSINKQLKIGDLTAKLPIIQGGMGVGVSGERRWSWNYFDSADWL